MPDKLEAPRARNGLDVADARITKSSYKPVGRNASRYRSGYFDGFLEMNVLSAVSTWRYPPRTQPCNGEFTFTYQLAQQTPARDRAKRGV